MEDKIIQWLAQGLLPAKVAEVVGCTPAYVSMVSSSEGFPERLEREKKKYKQSKEEEEIEETYIKLESKVQKAMAEALPFAEFGELTRAMETLIRRKQHSAPAGALVNGSNNHVRLTVINMPRAAIPEVVISSDGEMLSVDGKSLAPMPSSSVRQLFESKRKAKLQAEEAEILTTPVPLLASPSSKPKAHKLISGEDD